jgi:c-di-GMP-binding flagellar brake protein YcgR
MDSVEDALLRLFVDGKKVNIIDISLGGAKFSHNKDLSLEIRGVVQAALDIGGESFKLAVMILRTWEGEQGMSPRLRIASARFVDLDRKTESALSRKIHEIEREGIAIE